MSTYESIRPVEFVLKQFANVQVGDVLTLTETGEKGEVVEKERPFGGRPAQYIVKVDGVLKGWFGHEVDA